MRTLHIPQEKFLENLGKYLFSNQKINSDYVEHLKTALKPSRGLSPNYFQNIESSLCSVIDDWGRQPPTDQSTDREKITHFFISAIHIVLDNYQEIQNSIDITDDFYLPENFCSPTLMKDFSPAFSYRLNQCFGAISLLTKHDIQFLIMYHLYHLEDKIDRIFPQYYDVSSENLFNKIISPDWSKFQKMRDYFSNHSKGYNSDPIKNWATFLEKYQKERTYQLSNTKGTPYTKMNISFFIKIIYPKDGEVDTDFTERDIDALMKFRLFLSDDAQAKFLSEIKKRHPRPV